MFFLPFLAGAAVIGAGAYYISKVIQSNKPITINLLKEILFQEAHNSLRSIIKKVDLSIWVFSTELIPKTSSII